MCRPEHQHGARSGAVGQMSEAGDHAAAVSRRPPTIDRSTGASSGPSASGRKPHERQDRRSERTQSDAAVADGRVVVQVRCR